MDRNVKILNPYHFYRVRYSDILNSSVIREWIDENCSGNYYFGNDWAEWDTNGKNRMVEFELEEDSILFSLRWA